MPSVQNPREILIFLLLALATATAANAKTFTGTTIDERAQRQLVIIVNGRPLAGVDSSPQQRNGRLFLPVASIASSLGDALNIDADSRVVKVRRQNGIEAEFDAGVNQIRENGSVVLVVSGSSEIVFPPNPSELMLPLEIVSGLLGVSIRLDEALKAIVITRGETRAETVKTGARHSVFELYEAGYEYNLNRFASSTNQNLILSAAGRLADGRFTLLSNLSGASKMLSFRHGTFIFERARGQKFVAGDFGSGTDLTFMSATVRGASAQIPIGDGMRLTAFGGRSNSGAFFPFAVQPNGFEPPIARRRALQFDTNIFGVYATFGASRARGRNANPLTFSSGAMLFSSPSRSGEMLTGGAQYATSRLRLQMDVAAGKFSGWRGDNARVEGFGAAADVSATFQLLDNLSFQGRFAYTGKNFLSPQAGQREPVRLLAGGVAWQPKKWLAASIGGSASVRPDGSGGSTLRDRFLTTTLNLTPKGFLPKIFFSHTESATPQIRRASFTLLSASKDFSRLSLFANASRVKTFGAASLNGQLGANFRLNEANAFEVSQSFGSGGNLSGFVDWQGAGFFKKRLNLGAGLGYTRGSDSSVTTSQRLNASVRLPRKNLLQISYLQTRGEPTLLVSLRGSLFKKRAAETMLDAPLSEINSYGSFSGRVYQDINLDGKFDAGIDQPQANVKVRVDGSRYVESDANGLFKIEGVKTGQHRIYLDLLSVRADLTLLGEAEQSAELLAGRDSLVDFRLVRTGRISGQVWLDANENGEKDENEPALADVRVVSGGGRDTLTDANGAFLFGDLPPGEYVILLDEKTLPEKTKSARPTYSLKVTAARETADANFPVIAIPAEVKRFAAKTKE
ncbi:MAG TPA: SdrD B-like domain-containing protein [Pyrinomonadaceae bacterium]